MRQQHQLQQQHQHQWLQQQQQYHHHHHLARRGAVRASADDMSSVDVKELANFISSQPLDEEREWGGGVCDALPSSTVPALPTKP